MTTLEYYLLGCDACSVAELRRFFGETYCLHLHGRGVSHASRQQSLLLLLVASLAYSLTLKMEAVCSSEMSVTSTKLNVVTSQEMYSFACSG
jgi:hypothetical protein